MRTLVPPLRTAQRATLRNENRTGHTRHLAVVVPLDDSGRVRRIPRACARRRPHLLAAAARPRRSDRRRGPRSSTGRGAAPRRRHAERPRLDRRHRSGSGIRLGGRDDRGAQRRPAEHAPARRRTAHRRSRRARSASVAGSRTVVRPAQPLPRRSSVGLGQRRGVGRRADGVRRRHHSPVAARSATRTHRGHRCTRRPADGGHHGSCHGRSADPAHEEERRWVRRDERHLR
jgi:hypothetical protein